MQKVRVIYSSTENDFYRGFSKIAKTSWERIGIIPTHIKINKNIINFDDKNLEFNFFDEVFLSKVIRLLIPYFYKDDICILSDIDIIPLNKSYFLTDENDLNNDFLVLRSNEIKNNQIPICWNKALGETWSKIFKINSEEDVVEKINLWYQNAKESDYLLTYYDQIMLFDFISDFKNKNQKKVFFLNDFDKNFLRLDRKNYQDSLKLIFLNRKFTDFHLPRPYESNKVIIELVANAYLSKSFVKKLSFRYTTIFYIIYLRIKNFW